MYVCLLLNSGWKDGPSLPESEGRANFATAADNSSIYVFGGIGGITCDNMMDDVYRLNVRTSTWSNAGKIPELRSGLAVAVLPDSIVVIGGCSNGNVPTKKVWFFSLDGSQWRDGPPMPNPRCLFAAVSLKNTVYAIGGYSYDAQTSAMALVDAYSADTNSWRSVAPMNRARWGLAAVEYGGKIYVAGGAQNTTLVREIEVYDPVSNTWAFLTSLIEPRVSLAMAVAQGSVFIMGGTSDWKGTSLSSVEVYNIGANEVDTSKPMTGARFGLGAATVNNVIYAIGGIHTVAASKSGRQLLSTTICDSLVEEYAV